MDKISLKQAEIIRRKFYEIHEIIRTQKWDSLYTDNITMKCTPEDIMFEIAEYPGTVTKCDYKDFEKAVEMGDEGVMDRGILAWASVWLDGVKSDLSIECVFKFIGDTLTHTTIYKVHVD